MLIIVRSDHSSHHYFYFLFQTHPSELEVSTLVLRTCTGSTQQEFTGSSEAVWVHMRIGLVQNVSTGSDKVSLKSAFTFLQD